MRVGDEFQYDYSQCEVTFRRLNGSGKEKHSQKYFKKNKQSKNYLLLFLNQTKYANMSSRKNLYAQNPWHAVSIGKKIPQFVQAIIEIPKGSKAKYELDKESGLLKLDRVLFSAVHYPANYGFIPQTYCDDKDPLDILVICSVDVEPLCLIEAKVIGVMHMIDGGEIDDKIIAVAAHD